MHGYGILCTYFQSHLLCLLRKEIKQSFVNLSSIIDPDVGRKRKITFKEWTNWLQHDHLSEAEDNMFNDNPEHFDWRNEFLRSSKNNEKITLAQVEEMEKINMVKQSFVTKKCLKSYLTGCFIVKNKKTDFLTWTEFVHWINSLGK